MTPACLRTPAVPTRGGIVAIGPATVRLGRLVPVLVALGVLLSTGSGTVSATERPAVDRAPDPIPSSVEAPVSISITDVPLKTLVQMWSRERGVNIVCADDAGGTVSLELTSVPFDDALRAAAGIAGFEVIKRGTIYYLRATGDDADGSSELLDARSYRLNFANPAELEPVVTDMLSPWGSATSYHPMRAIVVEDIPWVLERIAGVVEALDQPPRQVLIDAKVLEARLADNSSIGIDWSAVFGGDDEGVVGQSGFAGSTGETFFVSWDDVDVSAALDAVEGVDELRSLASPQLLVTDGQEARLIIGGQLGFRVRSTVESTVFESVEFLDVGTQLIVTPTITDHGWVQLAIHPEISDGQIQEGLPSKTTAEVTTTVLLRDGQTILIGGLMRDRDERTRRGIPLLRSLPLIGALFGRTTSSSTRNEIITLIRVRIVPLGSTPPIDAHALLDDAELGGPGTGEEPDAGEERDPGGDPGAGANSGRPPDIGAEPDAGGEADAGSEADAGGEAETGGETPSPPEMPGDGSPL